MFCSNMCYMSWGLQKLIWINLCHSLILRSTLQLINYNSCQLLLQLILTNINAVPTAVCNAHGPLPGTKETWQQRSYRSDSVWWTWLLHLQRPMTSSVVSWKPKYLDMDTVEMQVVGTLLCILEKHIWRTLATSYSVHSRLVLASVFYRSTLTASLLSNWSVYHKKKTRSITTLVRVVTAMYKTASKQRTG